MLFTFKKIRVKPGTVLIEIVLSGDPLYLVKNITPKLSKLYLFTNLVQDKHIEVLVGRTEGTVMSEGTIFMHNR